MIQREDEERKSDHWLKKKRVAFANGGPNESLKINAQIQTQIVAEFGFGSTGEKIGHSKMGLDLLRSAVALFPELKPHAGYLKYNRVRAITKVKLNDEIDFETTLALSVPGAKTESFLPFFSSTLMNLHSYTVVMATSYSWPPAHELMSSIQSMCDIYPHIQFVILYIAEAHAKDEWDIGAPEDMCIKQPQTDAERLKQAQHAYKMWNIEKTRIQFYCSKMGSDFETLFAPWPLRFYVFESNKLVFHSEFEQNDSRVTLYPLRQFLSSCFL